LKDESTLTKEKHNLIKYVDAFEFLHKFHIEPDKCSQTPGFLMPFEFLVCSWFSSSRFPSKSNPAYKNHTALNPADYTERTATRIGPEFIAIGNRLPCVRLSPTLSRLRRRTTVQQWRQESRYRVNRNSTTTVRTTVSCDSDDGRSGKTRTNTQRETSIGSKDRTIFYVPGFLLDETSTAVYV